MRVFFMLAISSPYNLWRVLASIYYIFIPSSVFYPPIRVLSPHPCFIPSPVFYPLIRAVSVPSVSVSVFYSNLFYPCNAKLTARLIVSVDRDARFCALELDVLLAILLVDANSR